MNRRVSDKTTQNPRNKFRRYLALSLLVHLVAIATGFSSTEKQNPQPNNKNVVNVTALTTYKSREVDSKKVKKQKKLNKSTDNINPVKQHIKSKQSTGSVDPVKSTKTKDRANKIIKKKNEGYRSRHVAEQETDSSPSTNEKSKPNDDIDKVRQMLRDLETDSQNTGASSTQSSGGEFESNIGEWLGGFLREAWSLSRYQIDDEALEATASIIVLPSGRISSAKIINPSGNSVFDRSVKSALDKLSNVPIARISKPYTIEINFNLKDLDR